MKFRLTKKIGMVCRECGRVSCARRNHPPANPRCSECGSRDVVHVMVPAIACPRCDVIRRPMPKTIKNAAVLQCSTCSLTDLIDPYLPHLTKSAKFLLRGKPRTAKTKSS